MRFRKYLRPLKLQLRKLQAIGVTKVRPEVVGVLPHDSQAFTQGLFLHGDKLYESTGTIGGSSLRVIDKSSGYIERLVPVKDVFSEGIARLGTKIYQLTWKSGIVLVYDLVSLEKVAFLANDKPGWGMTSDGTRLIVSSGSSYIDFRDENFDLIKSTRIMMNGLPLSLINDLAYDRGKLYFNVYRHSRIYEADAESGDVLRIFDLGELAKKESRDSLDYPNTLSRENVMLNGIAIDETSGLAYITGKMWSHYYQIKVRTP